MYLHKIFSRPSTHSLSHTQIRKRGDADEDDLAVARGPTGAAAQALPPTVATHNAPDKERASIKDNITAAVAAHNELKSIWFARSDQIITHWKDMWDPSKRAAALKTHFGAFGKAKRKKIYPEVRQMSPHLASGTSEIFDADQFATASCRPLGAGRPPP